MQARKRTLISDGLFWGAMGALMAGILGGAIGYVFAQLHGAGWVSGAALGAGVFLVAGVILSRTATSAALPPPNTLRAPVAPPGGAFRAPPGGRFQPAAAVDRAAAAVPQAAPAAPPAAPAQGNVVEKSDAPAPLAEAAPDAAQEADQPPTLAAPGAGVGDDLKKIRGVGPKLEAALHRAGYYEFAQVAAWSASESAWIDAHVEGVNGRATRDDWAGQARALAAEA